MPDVQKMPMADLKHADPPPVIAIGGVPIERIPQPKKVDAPTP
jgi:hypothetical protein